MPEDSLGVSRGELKASLLFFRRELTKKIALTMLGVGWTAVQVNESAEDLANALTERLAARETSNPDGYKG